MTRRLYDPLTSLMDDGYTDEDEDTMPPVVEDPSTLPEQERLFRRTCPTCGAELAWSDRHTLCHRCRPSHPASDHEAIARHLRAIRETDPDGWEEVVSHYDPDRHHLARMPRARSAAA